MNDKYYFMDRCSVGEKIVFKYCKNQYIIDKTNNIYSLHNITANSCQCFNTYEELFQKGIINGNYLIEILDDIEIIFIDFNTKKEFSAAVEMNREIEFEYNGVNYFKSCSDKGYYIYNSKENSYQYFKTPKELLEKSEFEGKHLDELWDKINIRCIY